VPDGCNLLQGKDSASAVSFHGIQEAASEVIPQRVGVDANHPANVGRPDQVSVCLLRPKRIRNGESRIQVQLQGVYE